ncbi:MAG: hypothetical protein I3273_02115 [Candidatus Moeniiplasma glomeromycotorum]|nr:hypothetical protein [Candidatus Moeniiplasma glomeromycotorum]MCE8167085.1 hypothetical protein [Candidatus Moeniiplasma glomeromycotorum]MCE8168903.1 hypothetical protein [Candidatus Moeniiplasma glomeromycotorum]
MAVKKTHNTLAHYPQVFLRQIGSRTIIWLIFLPLFIGLGKRFATVDLVGKVYHFFFRQTKIFEQYFLGTGQEEKNKLLNLALYFILAIIALNILALLINYYLWNKDRYIENNNFYLHNKWVFIINSLIHLASAFLLTFSLASALTTILTLLFISFSTWERGVSQKLPSPQLEKFFTWKVLYIQKILLYSAIVIFVVPLVIGYFQHFHNAAMNKATEGFAKAYQEMINSSNVVKSLVELVNKANYSLFHWVILIWFAKGLISERISEFSTFWAKVNGIEKRVANFKHHYYYQESWSQTKRTPIKLGDYSYLENIPSFLNQEYLEKSFDINEFAQRNRQVVQHIEFCEQKVKQPSKKNFLNYCLFNEFKTWSSCLRTQDLLKQAVPN